MEQSLFDSTGFFAGRTVEEKGEEKQRQETHADQMRSKERIIIAETNFYQMNSKGDEQRQD